MRSMEVDILKDGAMDYPDDVLEEIDVVIGGVHGSFGMSEAEMTERILKAVRHPKVHVIGHLSGRLLGRRDAYRLDAEAVLKEAARRGKVLEINAQPERQDLTDIQARRAKEMGVPLILSTDAHSTDQLYYMEMAVRIARRAWLEKKDLMNCMGFKELCECLKLKPGRFS